MSPEVKKIIRELKKHPHAHIHYFADRMWSMFPSKELFDSYYKKGNGFKDLSEIEIMQGDDFDSTYVSPLVEALSSFKGVTTSSI